LGNLGGGARVFATGFWTPLERRRRADLALLTRERLQTKIVNMIGTGNRKKLAVLTACFAPCGLVRC